MNTYNTTLQTNNTSLSSILNTINALPDAGGVELPELTNPAAASEIGLNKEAIDAEGNKITGTFTLDDEIDSQEDLISQIAAALEMKITGGFETCEVTIIHQWGGNDDPVIGEMAFYFTTLLDNGVLNSEMTSLTSDVDFLPEHRVTLRTLKNIPIIIKILSSSWNSSNGSINITGGTLKWYHGTTESDTSNSALIGLAIPTGDTVTITARSN